MSEAPPDLARTPLLLPPDAKLLPVHALSPRLRAALGPEVPAEAVVLTRPGFRVATRLLPAPLAALLGEFRAASLLAEAVARFSRARGADPQEVLDFAFDALATLVEGRLLVPATSPEAGAPAPSLAAGQGFAGVEIERLLRGLDDTEVYRARRPDGTAVALKLARDGRAAGMLAAEARLLADLGGGDTPALIAEGVTEGRAWLAMEWRAGVPVAAAAQAARVARDRRGLHRLVARMLDAYGRLHARGVLHGDVHTGNILVAADGRVSLIDLGQARRIGEGGSVDPHRTGIPQFHDPEMAAALLAGRLPPAATPAAEQYAVGALAYLLLTGLPAIRPVAEREGLWARIAQRPPLPFPARGVAAWPTAEAALRRAMARAPQDRFPDMAGFARAFRAAAPRPTAVPDAARAVADALRRGVVPRGASRLEAAWLALRASFLDGDPDLLALADLHVAVAEPGLAGHAVAAAVARARSDRAAEAAALARFHEAAAALAGAARWPALRLAARLLDGAETRGVDAAPLRDRASTILAGIDAADAQALHAALALGMAGVLPLPADGAARLAALQGGSAWLWALAHDAYADPALLARAVAAPRPRDPVARALACLRLHQATGEARWVMAARRAATAVPAGSVAAALLALECAAPWRAVPAPWCLADS